VKLDWSAPDRGRSTFKEIPGSAFELRRPRAPGDGFVHMEHGPLSGPGVATDAGELSSRECMTNIPACSARRCRDGASLVVRAINLAGWPLQADRYLAGR